MELRDMKIALEPYSDGSGYKFEVVLKEDTVSLWSLNHYIEMNRDECSKIMDAIDELWAARDKIMKAA